MSVNNFQEMIEAVKKAESKKVAVVVAEDTDILKAVRKAQDEGLTTAILTGDETLIKKIAAENSISLDGFEIINEPDHSKAAATCCKLIRDGKASVIVKGLIDTSKYMKAILNKEKGLNKGNLISHVAAFEVAKYSKILYVTDAAINIAPDLNQKIAIINNAVNVVRSTGIEKPLVACCAAVEKVNPSAMPATTDAALLAKMNDRGQIKNCIVDGPLGLDNAVSEESAKIKNISGPVAGKADIIMCNDIQSANYLYKSLVFLAGAKAAAIVSGASAPIVLTSRADSDETKYLSIVFAILNSMK